MSTASQEPRSWGHRHFVEIMTTVMVTLLVLVISVQVAC
jgi:hypothetical protein